MYNPMNRINHFLLVHMLKITIFFYNNFHHLGLLIMESRFIRYLHEVCSPSVVHKNVNSVNIALDAELNPHLSDCGLANYIPEADQVSIKSFSIIRGFES